MIPTSINPLPILDRIRYLSEKKYSAKRNLVSCIRKAHSFLQIINKTNFNMRRVTSFTTLDLEKASNILWHLIKMPDSYLEN